jgi:transaldolase
MKTRIFLDSADHQETEEVIKLLGFLDGQTTNPTLIAKNKNARKGDILAFYKEEVIKISQILPQGSVSVEVYSDKNTKAGEMLKQGKEMFSWIPNAHIKYPTTQEGLKAAEESIKLGMRVNMTLCFSQGQAAAVYSATMGAKKGDVFVSPFIGRLDDKGENGMDLIKNIIEMYKLGDGHVEVLTASVRNLNHLLSAIQLGSDIITAPLKVLKEWKDSMVSLKPIEYKEIDLNKPWEQYDIHHDLTDTGIAKFSEDWNNLIK